MGIYKFKNEYEFLSMKYPCRIKIKDIEFPDAERAFAAIRFIDPEFVKKCLTCDEETLDYFSTKVVEGPLVEPDFKYNISGYLYKVLCEKFKDSTLQQKLVDTGDEMIIFLDKKNLLLGRHKGKGSNLLGACLMRIRSEILMNRNKQLTLNT